jgi:hypothetical protein
MAHGIRSAAEESLRRIAIATAVVGTLDISEVIVYWGLRGVAPTRVLQGVAAGWYGRDAAHGGLATALVGLLTHFFIAFCVVVTYHYASRGISFLRDRPLVAGALYGLAVFVVMTYGVVPLSNALNSPRPWYVTANLIFAHVACVGIPTGYLARVRSTPPALAMA